jgi:hypothetical protein
VFRTPFPIVRLAGLARRSSWGGESQRKSTDPRVGPWNGLVDEIKDLAEEGVGIERRFSARRAQCSVETLREVGRLTIKLRNVPRNPFWVVDGHEMSVRCRNDPIASSMTCDTRLK